MEVKITNKKLNEFPPPLRKAIRNLSLRKIGHSKLIVKAEPDVDTFIMTNDSDVLIGWAMCSRHWRASAERPTIMLYIRKSMRRKGLGSKLMAAIVEKYTDVAICPWNHESRGFFDRIRESYPNLPNASGYW